MNDTKLQQVKQFYSRFKRLPTYTEMLKLFGFASRNAVHWVIGKWVKEGLLEKIGNRLSPTAEFFNIPVLGVIPAGQPTTGSDYFADDYVSLDQYLVRHPGFTYLLRVRGDSMINAGIHEGDLVIIDRKLEPKHGDIVAALIDNEWTLKYFQNTNGQVYLKAANPAYDDLRPRENLTVGGVVVKVIKEFY